jgi:hypothetical protein
LLTDVTLFTVAEDVGQPAGLVVERTMQVLWLSRRQRKAFIETLQELREEGVRW